jgi:Spy/CpxP family protein refolding chaperone
MIQQLALTLILGTVLSAQVPDLKAVLNLSDTQIQSLVQLQQQKPQTLQPLVQQMEQDQQKLQQLLASNPDPAAVGRLVIEINTLGRQIQQVISNIQQQALNILRPDQRNQVQPLGDVLRLQLAARQAVELGLINPPN